MTQTMHHMLFNNLYYLHPDHSIDEEQHGYQKGNIR